MARLELIADTYLSVSTPVQLALPRLLEESATFRETALARLRSNREILAAAAARSRVHVLPAQAGWYAILELPASLDEERLVHDLLEYDDVLVHPGFFFDLPARSHVVVSLLTETLTLAEGISRLLARMA
jgi:hypothetical protein